MTWVLAKSFVQDYSLIISDICVTSVDRKTGKETYADCLLKIHVISRDNGLIVGFSGNVENAFNVIYDMRILANSMALKSRDRKFDVLDFIIQWREFVKSQNKHQYVDDAENGVHMFIAGNHTDNNSTGNKYATCAVYQIKSPDYRPMATHPFYWSDMGSGSGMDICKQIIDQLSKDPAFRVLPIDSTPEKVVDFLAPRISKALDDRLSEKGVSSRLTIGLSVAGDIGLAATYEKDESGRNSLAELVENYEQLLDRLGISRSVAKFYAPNLLQPLAKKSVSLSSAGKKPLLSLNPASH